MPFSILKDIQTYLQMLPILTIPFKLKEFTLTQLVFPYDTLFLQNPIPNRMIQHSLLFFALLINFFFDILYQIYNLPFFLRNLENLLY